MMRLVLTKIGLWIQKAIDFTHPLFRRYIPIQMYRYAVCGGGNVVFDWVLYFIVYNLVFKDTLFDLGIVTLSPHIATLVIIFPVTTFSGFLLQKYVTFTSSDLRGHIQLIRYFMVVFINLFINYVGLKLFVDGLNFYPTPSKMVVTIFAVICSYFFQTKYTFKSSSTTTS
jgi:putative flippase GtrA